MKQVINDQEIVKMVLKAPLMEYWMELRNQGVNSQVQEIEAAKREDHKRHLLYNQIIDFFLHAFLFIHEIKYISLRFQTLRVTREQAWATNVTKSKVKHDNTF